MATITAHLHHLIEHDEEAAVVDTAASRALAALRIGFGLIFLWAFFDKLLALGYSTGVGQDGTTDRFGPAAWIHGGSPTKGFLGFAADGPFRAFWNGLAGTAFADWAFMLGLLGIGIALTFGIGMRIGTVAGFVMYVLMWSVVLPPATNPVLDDHVLGAISMLVLGLTGAGATWGLGHRWSQTAWVRRFPVLR
ncbi:DoxX family membrane protein [Nocardioides ginsengisoli]|uniref:Thiosulfate dehydrogenase [quinone] large subunit n=1 Tax=Nocardioides ginsengisoli TaxID=363868 RepID=A0ABW3VX73_9ACTN